MRFEHWSSYIDNINSIAFVINIITLPLTIEIATRQDSVYSRSSKPSMNNPADPSALFCLCNINCESKIVLDIMQRHTKEPCDENRLAGVNIAQMITYNHPLFIYSLGPFHLNNELNRKVHP